MLIASCLLLLTQASAQAKIIATEQKVPEETEYHDRNGVRVYETPILQILVETPHLSGMLPTATYDLLPPTASIPSAKRDKSYFSVYKESASLLRNYDFELDIPNIFLGVDIAIYADEKKAAEVLAKRQDPSGSQNAEAGPSQRRGKYLPFHASIGIDGCMYGPQFPPDLTYRRGRVVVTVRSNNFEDLPFEAIARSVDYRILQHPEFSLEPDAQKVLDFSGHQISYTVEGGQKMVRASDLQDLGVAVSYELRNKIPSVVLKKDGHSLVIAPYQFNMLIDGVLRGLPLEAFTYNGDVILPLGTVVSLLKF